MRIISQDILDKAVRKHADARQWVSTWSLVARAAAWQGIDEVRIDYPAADGVRLPSGEVVTIFNVRGNNYRLLTIVDYASRSVEVLELITHAEYSKDHWKQRY